MVNPQDSSSSTGPSTEQPDPDGDPGNLNPRDTRQSEDYEGDPDGDPGNLNPRDDRQTEEGQ